MKEYDAIEQAYKKGYVDAMASIVRCKDCEFFSIDACIGIMPGYGFAVSPMDFCSKGERRTDNERKAD